MEVTLGQCIAAAVATGDRLEIKAALMDFFSAAAATGEPVPHDDVVEQICDDLLND